MNHFASARMNLRSWRWTNLKAIAGFACALSMSGIAHGQALSGAAPATVTLTSASYLPMISEGSVKTTIATNLDGSAPSSPWQISLLNLGRNEHTSGQTYQVQMTNTSAGTLSLPVGNDGQAIWDACQKSEITEVNIALRVAGQIAPAANLPAVHSCAAVSSSSLTVAPGASVIFTAALPGTLLAPSGPSVSAVVSICSAVYSVDGGASVTTRQCQVPVVSNAASLTATSPIAIKPISVVNPIAGVK